MPLPRYGVLVGQFDHFERDPINNFGSFFHGHVFVRAPAAEGSDTLFRCAVDVKEPNGVVEFSELPRLDRALFYSVGTLADGYHELARTRTSGAIDYVRSGILSVPHGCVTFIFSPIAALLGSRLRPTWQQNVGGSALNRLEMFIAGSQKLYVFGAPFDEGNGMHDVHMNQGDPLPITGESNFNQKMKFYNNSGVWQDGAVFADAADGSLKAFLVKFITQSFRTDEMGHPL
jgi:Uncharacterized conserved protein (DUF2278)